MTDALILDGDVGALAVPETEALILDGDVVALAVPFTRALVVDGDVAALVYRSECITARCTIWTITRRDGEVFRFTSLDEDFTWGANLFHTCGSLSPSASEQSADADSVGNTEIMGLLDSELITPGDLYIGLFDDAFIEVWAVPYLPNSGPPERLAAGWTGEVSQGDTSWRAEVLGPGARLQQRPLVYTITPGCRRDFGSAAGELPPSGCGIDREALKITGTVTAATRRTAFASDVADPMIAAQWPLGTVRWTSGQNTGAECEVMTVDFTTGVVVLWPASIYTPLAGDTFDLLPGCDLSWTACQLYANEINFGGFKDVPGSDAVLKPTNVKS